jgi:inosine-uridine nucleoside N-ribohydrolase
MMPENCFTEEEIKYIEDTGTPLTKALSEQMRIWLKKKEELNRLLGRSKETIRIWLHDPLTIMTLIDEKIVKLQNTEVEVKMIDGTLKTVANLFEGVPMNVAYDADFKAFKKRLISRLVA